MPGAVDAHYSQCGEDMTDIEVWEPNGPGFGRFTEKVWMFSGSRMNVTERVAATFQRRHRGEEATATQRRPSHRNPLLAGHV